MADNVQLSQGSQDGAIIRTKAKGSYETPVSLIDVGGSNAEALVGDTGVYMPVDGEVIEVNPALEDTPELVNSQPFGEGWMIRIKLSDPAQLDELLSADQYRSMIG